MGFRSGARRFREAASNLSRRMRKAAAEGYKDGQVSERLQENKVPQRHQTQGLLCRREKVKFKLYAALCYFFKT